MDDSGFIFSTVSLHSISHFSSLSVFLPPSFSPHPNVVFPLLCLRLLSFFLISGSSDLFPASASNFSFYLIAVPSSNFISYSLFTSTFFYYFSPHVYYFWSVFCHLLCTLFTSPSLAFLFASHSLLHHFY